MKTLLYGLLPFLFLLNGCKEDETQPQYYWGEASALRNGKTWTDSLPMTGLTNYVRINARSFESCNTSIVMERQYYNQYNTPHNEMLIFANVPTEAGAYEIHVIETESIPGEEHIPEARCTDSTINVSLGTLISGDVVDKTYALLEEDPKQITITEYDSTTGEIRGTFEVGFVLLPDRQDTVRFTGGAFHTKVLPEGQTSY